MSKFFKPTPYNNETKNQMWMSIIGDGHDICCGCPTPFAHLLDSIFPEGHTDRHRPISEIIERDYQACHSGGPEDVDLGLVDIKPDTPDIKPEETEQDGDADLDTLLAAAAEDAEKSSR